jgi:hypothetical protein
MLREFACREVEASRVGIIEKVSSGGQKTRGAASVARRASPHSRTRIGFKKIPQNVT